MQLNIQELLTCLFMLIVPCVSGSNDDSVLTLNVDNSTIHFHEAALKGLQSCFWNHTATNCKATFNEDGSVDEEVSHQGSKAHPFVLSFSCTPIILIGNEQIECNREIEKPLQRCITGNSVSFKHNLTSEDNCTYICWEGSNSITQNIQKDDYFCNSTNFNTTKPTTQKMENTTPVLQPSNNATSVINSTSVLSVTTVTAVANATEDNVTALANDDENSEDIVPIIGAVVAVFLVLVIAIIVILIVWWWTKRRRTTKRSKCTSPEANTNETETSTLDTRKKTTSSQNEFKSDNGTELCPVNVYDEAFVDDTDPAVLASPGPTADLSLKRTVSEKSFNLEEEPEYSSIGDSSAHAGSGIHPKNQNKRQIRSDASVHSDDTDIPTGHAEIIDDEYAVVVKSKDTYSRPSKKTRNIVSPYDTLSSFETDPKYRRPVATPKKRKTVDNESPMVDDHTNVPNSRSYYNVTVDEDVEPLEYDAAEEMSGDVQARGNNPLTDTTVTRNSFANIEPEPVYAVVNKRTKKKREKSEDFDGLEKKDNTYFVLEKQGEQSEGKCDSEDTTLSGEEFEDNEKPIISGDNDQTYVELQTVNDFEDDIGGKDFGLEQTVESEI